MNWIDIKDFDYDEKLLKGVDEFDEFDLAYGVQAKEVIVLTNFYDGKPRIKDTFLIYRRYKTVDNMPEDIKEAVDEGHFIKKEHEDGTITVYSFIMASFNNVLAYIFTDDMIKDYQVLQDLKEFLNNVLDIDKIV